MLKYEIYTELNSDHLSENYYHGTYEFPNRREAERYAYDLAWEGYESYSGKHGFYTWESMRQEIADAEYDGDISKVPYEEVDTAYIEEVERHTYYRVTPTSGRILDDEFGDDDDFNDDDADCYCE